MLKEEPLTWRGGKGSAHSATESPTQSASPPQEGKAWKPANFSTSYKILRNPQNIKEWFRGHGDRELFAC